VNPELPEEKRETNRVWILRELRDLERAISMAREALASPEADLKSVIELL
jgi:hypothetical protein